MQEAIVKSQCCNSLLTHYDKGNGEKYLACYACYKAVNDDGSLKHPLKDQGIEVE